MIISFKHKGLEAFYATGSRKGIQPEHARKLSRILSLLDVAQGPANLNLPGYRLHQLKGDLQDHWSMRVTGNWRVTFRFHANDVELLDYQDYH